MVRSSSAKVQKPREAANSQDKDILTEPVIRTRLVRFEDERRLLNAISNECLLTGETGVW